MHKVFIGVGHGGGDPGAVAGGLQEKDINLVMALAMKAELERRGVEVGISRTADTDDTTAQEIQKCVAFGADIAVEVHNNAGGGKGFEVYRQTSAATAAASTALAKAIEARVVAMGQNSRGVKTMINSSGSDYFGWLRQLSCPAVLCEGAFLDNAADMQMIDTEAKQQRFGTAYAQGVLDYLESTGTEDTARLTPICGQSQATAAQMGAFLRERNPGASDYAAVYLEEGAVEGIRGDIAFAQSCVETGFWRFGGDVKPEQNNFCGLGATGGGEPGCGFATPLEGIRAQIQHLKAYASTEALKGECIDPRFGYVQRGCAPYVEWLGIPDNPEGRGWAAGKAYGKGILEILDGIQGTASTHEPDDQGAQQLENAQLRERVRELEQLLDDIAELLRAYRPGA